MVEIRYKDIDPDSGDITRDELVCQCPTDMIAEWVYSALVRDMSLDYDEPNREFYIKKINEKSKNKTFNCSATC
jgi:hypothetical protein